MSKKEKKVLNLRNNYTIIINYLQASVCWFTGIPVRIMTVSCGTAQVVCSSLIFRLNTVFFLNFTFPGNWFFYLAVMLPPCNRSRDEHYACRYVQINSSRLNVQCRKKKNPSPGERLVGAPNVLDCERVNQITYTQSLSRTHTSLRVRIIINVHNFLSNCSPNPIVK